MMPSPPILNQIP